MLKKLMRDVRRKLLKVNWIKREVEAYQAEKKKQAHHEHWSQIMHSGSTLRYNNAEKLEPVVRTGFIDSVNWGGTSIEAR